MSYTLAKVNYPIKYSDPEKFYQNDNIDEDLIEVESIGKKSNGSGRFRSSSANSLLAELSPIEQKQVETQQMMILQQLQQKISSDKSKSFDSYETYSIDSSILSLISHYAGYAEYADEYVEMNDHPLKQTSKTSSSFKLFDSLKEKLNRPRHLRHDRMLSELNIPAPGANEPIIFESMVQRWNSSVFKKRSSNNYLVLTRKCLCSFKNSDKAAKIFDGLPLCTLPPRHSTNSMNGDDYINKILPSENIILSLATVYAISEEITSEPQIRIDYISSPKKHAHISIISQNLQKHQQWLVTIRPAIRNVNAIGPYLTLNQREWFMSRLRWLKDLPDENEENLVGFRVLLKSITDEGSNDKEQKVTMFFVLGRNNVYLVPSNLVGNDSSSDDNGLNRDLNIKNQKQVIHYPLLLELKPKDIEIRKYQYPLLCLTSISSNGRDDSFQLTFKNSMGTMKRTLSLCSLLAENIITEIRTAIDSITFWWPSPCYQLKVPTSMQATILQPERDSVKTSQILGFKRMIEAQCHAKRVNRSRIAFNIEYVLGSESVIMGLGVENLPFRFTLLPPAPQPSTSPLEQDYLYTNPELMNHV